MPRSVNPAQSLLIGCAFVALAACTTGAPVAPSAAFTAEAVSPSIEASPSHTTASPSASESPSGSPSASPSPAPAVVVAAGDLATCETDTDDGTAALAAALVAEHDATVLTLGDHAYPDGTEAEFAQCYAPSWGQLLPRTRPTLGNHDYHTALGAPYFAYFGDAAGTPGDGWYSFDLGDWHVVSLNSNCELVGCSVDSPQGQWLQEDLAASERGCTLAFFHHPRWSSGPEGDQAKVAELWRLLVEGGADVAVSGHAHQYERLAPTDAAGAIDAERGIRQFVVGTGGRSLYGFGPINPASEVRSNTSYGVLKLVLRPDGYDWEFVPTEPGEFTDAGAGSCR
jgi:acid phosphatase type 7